MMNRTRAGSSALSSRRDWPPAAAPAPVGCRRLQFRSQRDADTEWQRFHEGHGATPRQSPAGARVEVMDGPQAGLSAVADSWVRSR